MTDKLEKEFMNGISQAAVTKGVWLLTTGLNEGVSKLIGQSVRRYRLLNKKSSNPTIIGLTSWGTVTEHTRKVLTWQTSRNIEYTSSTDSAEKRAPMVLNYDEKKTLDKHHSHFILLDNGRLGGYIDDNPRSDFVKKVQHECKCRAITVIVEGGLNTLQVIKNDLKAK
ncbi:unnamed protein product [Rotaria sp. Silwood1]|nr:unnamed protein product [Rotaria sp. Silwood1]